MCECSQSGSNFDCLKARFFIFFVHVIYPLPAILTAPHAVVNSIFLGEKANPREEVVPNNVIV